ncbi:MAG TPA: Flp family type IVb pilin [Acetobacteraceae bacterium]|jgi:Flp pilus assembly pilin Flp|nr:Flp family type IVb pilin [Acetobacteraceae bacterium]
MFKAMRTCWMTLRADQRGVTAVEYAVVAGIVVLTFGLAFTALGTSLTTFLTGLAL